MTNSQQTPGVVANRLDDKTYLENFAEAMVPLAQGAVADAAEHCLLCQDAPCVTACPAGINIPLFIEQIQTGEPDAAAMTVFNHNILAGICARVCPTDTLCEAACIRMEREGRPVAIAQLHRVVTDPVMQGSGHPFIPAADTGQHVAVVGAGPAGLACAHRLALHGHQVTIFDGRDKPGGLNEYGVAAYKLPGGFAQTEIEWLMRIGGITLKSGVHLGRNISLESLREDFDAVFLGLGLAGVNALRAEGEEHDHVHDAIDFIAAIRQADGFAEIPVGRNVVVLGGGRTAMDAAVQAKLLGAEHVTLVYRNREEDMTATEYEQLHAVSKGVKIITGAVPVRILGDGAAEAVEFKYTAPDPTGLRPGKDTFRVPADQVLKAIGQHLEEAPGGLVLDGHKIAVDANGRTSLEGVWAGGDCTGAESNLTVIAVAQGRDAAEDISAALAAQTGRG